MPLSSQKMLLGVTGLAILALLILWYRLSAILTTSVFPVTMSRPLPAVPEVKTLQPPSRLLPYQHWEHRKYYPDKYIQVSCSSFPKLEDIHYAGPSWQHLKVQNGSVYVYGAYWDNRFEEPLVRVLVYCDVTPLPTLDCHLWYENENAPITVPSKVQYAWREEWGGPKDGVNEPYILSCQARRHPPEKQVAPVAVSILNEGDLCGTPTNVLKVQGVPTTNNPGPRNNSKISVCLKWLQFRDDVSAELVEWIEFIKAFGADKLFAFDIQSHPNTRRVLDYYVATGFADVTEFAHAPQLRADFPAGSQVFYDYRRELLPLNDCLYRSINDYGWMTTIDSDEIIVPKSCNTWQEVIETTTADKKDVDSMSCRNYYFLDTEQKDLAAPAYFKILGHLWRTREPRALGESVKSFHNMSSVVAMHNHFPRACGNTGYCWCIDVNETVARLHHYRHTYGETEAELAMARDTVRDDTAATRWQHLRKEVDRVLDTLGIKPKI